MRDIYSLELKVAAFSSITPASEREGAYVYKYVQYLGRIRVPRKHRVHIH